MSQNCHHKSLVSNYVSKYNEHSESIAIIRGFTWRCIECRLAVENLAKASFTCMHLYYKYFFFLQKPKTPCNHKLFNAPPMLVDDKELLYLNCKHIPLELLAFRFGKHGHLCNTYVISPAHYLATSAIPSLHVCTSWNCIIMPIRVKPARLL